MKRKISIIIILILILILIYILSIQKSVYALGAPPNIFNVKKTYVTKNNITDPTVEELKVTYKVFGRKMKTLEEIKNTEIIVGQSILSSEEKENLYNELLKFSEKRIINGEEYYSIIRGEEYKRNEEPFTEYKEKNYQAPNNKPEYIIQDINDIKDIYSMEDPSADNPEMLINTIKVTNPEVSERYMDVMDLNNKILGIGGPYFVEEIQNEALPGYLPVYDRLYMDNDFGFNPAFNYATYIYNVETQNITVKKVWNDDNNKNKLRPNEVKLQLYKNGTPEGEIVTLNEQNGWKYTWNNLYKYGRLHNVIYRWEDQFNINRKSDKNTIKERFPNFPYEYIEFDFSPAMLTNYSYEDIGYNVSFGENFYDVKEINEDENYRSVIKREGNTFIIENNLLPQINTIEELRAKLKECKEKHKEKDLLVKELEFKVKSLKNINEEVRNELEKKLEEVKENYELKIQNLEKKLTPQHQKEVSELQKELDKKITEINRLKEKIRILEVGKIETKELYKNEKEVKNKTEKNNKSSTASNKKLPLAGVEHNILLMLISGVILIYLCNKYINKRKLDIRLDKRNI